MVVRDTTNVLDDDIISYCTFQCLAKCRKV